MAQSEQISVFDILKIGVGPSSSHTLGPWRAAQRFVAELEEKTELREVLSLQIHLYGSLAKTGKGHGTDTAILLSLLDEDPETVDTDTIVPKVAAISADKKLYLKGEYSLDFDIQRDILFHKKENLPFHPNGMSLTAHLRNGEEFSETYYSVGGGFVVKEGEVLNPKDTVHLPFPCGEPKDLLRQCEATGKSIAELIWDNELAWRSPSAVREGILKIWNEMKHCAFRGCHTPGELPGGLKVTRRAPSMHQGLVPPTAYQDADGWIETILSGSYSFEQVLNWVSCLAIAVNEENAAFGRVVTAPT